MMATAQAVWPAGTAHNLAATTHVTPRAAEFWLQGKYNLSLAAARDLLRTEEGYQFLAAMMGDCDARWWKRVKLNAAAAETRRALAEQAKKLERLRALRQQIDLDIE
jgi:hypothetical protein